jgi:hypothetical protein
MYFAAEKVTDKTPADNPPTLSERIKIMKEKLHKLSLTVGAMSSAENYRIRMKLINSTSIEERRKPALLIARVMNNQ